MTTDTAPAIPAERRDASHAWLRELTRIPTAAGREFRVVRWIERWVAERPDLALRADAHGNLEAAFRDAPDDEPPVYFTAHLDHPAFVVERVIGPQTLELAFRGGVMDEYFEDAPITIHTADDRRLPATLTGRAPGAQEPFKVFLADLDADADASDIAVGDVGTWVLPEPEIIDSVLHTDACDDLAAVAAALAAFEELRLARAAGEPIGDVRLLFTRAEEIGFIGAIGAARDRTMPEGSRLIALENSRSFPESPIGGGPIVRVGDRVSVFTPDLTGAVANVAEKIAGRSAHPLAVEKENGPAWRWQRKLMPGGACEASVFCAMGYPSSCLCLPLGNYHNMADLAAVQAGTNTARPRVGREHIALSDYDGLVDLLVACGRGLPGRPSFNDRLQKLWDERSHVLK